VSASDAIGPCTVLGNVAKPQPLDWLRSRLGPVRAFLCFAQAPVRLLNAKSTDLVTILVARTGGLTSADLKRSVYEFILSAISWDIAHDASC
jgi:hypothetical protein